MSKHIKNAVKDKPGLVRLRRWFRTEYLRATVELDRAAHQGDDTSEARRTKELLERGMKALGMDFKRRTT